MSSLDPNRSLPPLKSFALTHILYDPSHPSHISLPLTLLSLSPIFLFVSYFTLIIWTRRLTILILAIGSIGNEIANLLLKRIFRGDRPWKGYGEIGDGYGMPSSHSQAAGFLAAWGVGYALTLGRRRSTGSLQGVMVSSRREFIRSIRNGVFVIGLITWSLLVAYSRTYLLYHSVMQVVAGYSAGLALGSIYFLLTEYIPLYYPSSILGKLRASIAWLWEGIGGIAGHDLGVAPGGWGEGWMTLEKEDKME